MLKALTSLDLFLLRSNVGQSPSCLRSMASGSSATETNQCQYEHLFLLWRAMQLTRNIFKKAFTRGSNILSCNKNKDKINA